MKTDKIMTGALVQDSTGAVRELLRNDPTAIGYISLGQITPQVKAVPLSGIAPTEANVVAGRYPLVRPFLFVLKGEPSGVTKDFVDFVRSSEGQAMARREGLVPIK
jgi:phosphate transport system substrate-binding protein